MRVSRSRLLMATSAVALLASAGATTAHAATGALGVFPGTTGPATELFGTGAVNIPSGGDGTLTLTLTGNLPAITLWDVTLSNGATWDAALTTADVDVSACPTTPTVSFTSGGGDADSNVTIRLDNVANGCTAGDTLGFTFGFDDATALNSPGAQVLATTTLRDNVSTIDGGVTNSPFTLATSVDGTTFTGLTTGQQAIDVTSGSALFVAGGNTLTNDVELGTLTVADDANADEDDLVTAWTHGAGDATVTGAHITVTGDFSAAQQPFGGCTNGVYLDFLVNNNACDSGEEADTLTSSQAVFNFSNADFATVGGPHDLRMGVDGTTAITNQTVTAVTRIDWVNAAYADETSGLQTLNTLQRNGYNVMVNFWTAVADNTLGYRMAVRILNKSAVDGRLFIQLIPDGGTASAPTLVPDSIPGMSAGNVLAAGSGVELTNNQIEAITGTSLSASQRAFLQVTGEFSAGGGAVTPYLVNPGGTVTQLEIGDVGR